MSPRLTPRTDDRGVTAVEYALIVFLVGIGMLIGVVLMTRSFSAAFAASADQAGGSTSAPAQTQSQSPSDSCPADGEDHEEDDDCDDDEHGNEGNNNGVAGKPGVPTNVTATRSADGQITVSWTAPGSNGGRAITAYTVEFETESQVTTCDSTVTGWNNGSVTAQGSASSAAKSGLGSNWYCVRVYATNGVTSGATNYAYAGPVYSAITKPGAPRNVTASSSSRGQLTVTWDVPTSDGGAAIDQYTVEIDNRGTNTSCANNFATTSSTVVSSGTSTTFTGLPGDRFCVQVSAHNSAGDGTWAENGTFAVQPVVVPGAPNISSITSGDRQLSVAFTDPASDGGAAITNYKYSTDGGSNWSTRSPASTATPLVITGLTNGSPYNVVIRAVNSAGDGTASNSVSATPATTPGAPTIGTITRGNQQLSVAFTAGTTGGSAITNYEYSTDGGSTWTTRSPVSTSSPVVITGLTNGTSYSVQIRAVNGVGSGAASNSVTATPGRPSAPSITGITATSSSLSVSFTAPTDNGGSAITTYEYSTDGGTTWRSRSSASTSSPLTISRRSSDGNNLSGRTTYNVQIRAVTANGSGDASATVSKSTT